MASTDHLNTTEFVRESRRANANLRISKKDDPLGTIHMTDGTVSRHYPKDLESLLSLDGKFMNIRNNTFSELDLKLKLQRPSCLIIICAARILILKITTSTDSCNSVESNTNWWNEILIVSSFLRD